ncbi:hypothetical protein CISIN_1g0408921mg, partial [Citrus sinensis]
MSHKSKPRKTLISFFAKVDGGQSSNETSSPCNIDASSSPTSQRVEFEKVDNPSTIDTPYLECDSGLRISINTYPIDKREYVRMAYINMGSFQPELQKYPSTKYGHDESVNSLNRENFIELIKLLATINEEINKVVLENAPKNAQYIAPKIQKELLNILANKVQHKIRERIEDAKFCILFYEVLDESHKEQMTIILRYIDCDGFIRELFFEVVNDDDTKASTLKNEICNVLARYNLLIENLRGQGNCPYAYYVHCFAHRLQLVLVAVSKEVHEVWLFFSKLSSIANFVNASFKRYAELKAAKDKEIIELIASEELETGTSANQVRTLQRAGDTRWSSHFTSVSRLIEMF